jgi:hypothetical protein
MPTKSEVGKLASTKTKKEFGAELSRLTSLTEKEAKELFPKKSDREELVELLKIVNSASDDNQKKAKIVAPIGPMIGAVLTIAKKFALGL